MKPDFEPEEEMIPWWWGSESEGNRINTPLSKPERGGGKDSDAAMKQVSRAGLEVSIPARLTCLYRTRSALPEPRGQVSRTLPEREPVLPLRFCSVPCEPKAVS